LSPLPGQGTFPFVEPPESSGEPGAPCVACDGPTIITPGVGPHYAKIKCTKCGSWGWLPKPRAPREGGAA
jgi:hypothetical protein